MTLMVQKYGFSHNGRNGFISHEALSFDGLAVGHVPKTSNDYWSSHTTVTPDILKIAGARMIGDFESMPPKMRKVVTTESMAFYLRVASTYTFAGMIISCRIADSTFKDAAPKLNNKFMLKYMDDELERMHQLAPEPFDPTIMNDYKNIVFKELNEKRDELAQRDQELAEKVADATCEQIVEQVMGDWTSLELYLQETSTEASLNAAKDLQYLRARRARGISECEKFMDDALLLENIDSAEDFPEVRMFPNSLEAEGRPIILEKFNRTNSNCPKHVKPQSWSVSVQAIGHCTQEPQGHPCDKVFIMENSNKHAVSSVCGFGCVSF
jgi:hypothetical protein